MRGGPSRSSLFFLPVGFLLLGAPFELSVAAGNDCRLSGQVSNGSGAPLAAARVWVVSQSNPRVPVRQLKTNSNGRFEFRSLPAGLYAVRFSLESFEPHVVNHVRLRAGEKRRLDVRLRPEPRRRSRKEHEHEDWLWVLRARASLRSVLHFAPPAGRSPEGNGGPGLHGKVEVASTVGSSDSFFAESLQTRVAYKVPLGQPGRLVVVGGVGYQDAPVAVLETRWQPQGPLAGPEFFLGVREQLLPGSHSAAGDQFRRSLRVFRVGVSQQAALPAGVQMDYDVDYLVAAGLDSTARAVRPAIRLRRTLNGSTVLHYIFSSASPALGPLGGNPGGEEELGRALAESRSLPRLSRRAGSLRLERRAHQEAGVEHRFASDGRLLVAVFHLRVLDAALVGQGSAEGLEPGEFLSSPAASGFFYDGGDYATSGLRVAYLFRWFGRVDTMVGYVQGGGLALADGKVDFDKPLPERLEQQRAHALSARLSAQLPGSNTRVRVGYGWLSAPLLTLLDEGDQGDTQAYPYLNLRLQQPVPSFFIIPKGLAVLADVRNLLAQGSVDVPLPEGESVRLTPLHRSVRGGVVYQF